MKQRENVRIISTTPGRPWVERRGASVAPVPGKADLVVLPDQPLQVMDGFGGTFNELGWDALRAIPREGQDRVFRDLFGRDGIHFAMARTPVGASDYALSYYSYCDVKDDFTMRDFSIARDRYILIPYIKRALDIRPDLKIWASPWTPPAWMKVNEHYTLQGGDIAGRPGGNEMDSRRNVMGNATAFNMQVANLQAYALYFSKYVRAYAREGVRLWAIMPQNEIAWSPNWPCCTWRAEDLAIFIGTYLGPQFARDRVRTQIWLGTINFSDPGYVRTVLKCKDAAKYIRGVGFQWTGGEAIGAIHAEHPTMPLMQTENMCGDAENNWTSLTATWERVVHYLRHGARSYMYWNMVLDETGKSSWGWPQNSLVVVNRRTGKVRYTDEFYLMKHLSRMVQPGARLLALRGGHKDALAFRTAAGRVAVVMHNPERTPRKMVVEAGRQRVRLLLKAKSVTSLILRSPGGPS